MEKGLIMEKNLKSCNNEEPLGKHLLQHEEKLKENFDFDPRFDRIMKAYEKLGHEHITEEIVLKDGTIFRTYDAIFV